MLTCCTILLLIIAIINKNILREVVTEYYKCITVARKMYNIKFDFSLLQVTVKFVTIQYHSSSDLFGNNKFYVYKPTYILW